MNNQIFDPTAFAIEMPNQAPPLGFDPNAASFNWRDVMPNNYWSMDELEERRKQIGGWPILTPLRVVIKPVYDPAEWEGKEIPQDELAPKLVLEFAESAPALVLNKSRCEMVTRIVGSANPRHWAKGLGRIVLSVGVFNKRAQIGIEPAPPEIVEDDEPDWGAVFSSTPKPAAAPAPAQGQTPANGRFAPDTLNDELFG